VDSQEHSLFTTGMTNADAHPGTVRGPRCVSLYSAVRIDRNALSLTPWAELVNFSSDVYTASENGPVVRVSSGVIEHRFRAGIEAGVGTSA